MQVLTYEGVKAAALAAFNAGKLTAQHPDPLKRVCVYRTKDGYGCAVGVALTDESIALCDAKSVNGVTINNLLMYDVVEAASPRDLADIARLQEAHDAACTRGPTGELHLKEFRSMLD